MSFKIALARPGRKGHHGVLGFKAVGDFARDYFQDANDDDDDDDEAAKKERAEPNELRVALIQARNLKAMDRNLRGKLTSSDPLVTMSCVGERKSSTVKKKSLYPVWNEVFSFRVRPQDQRGEPLVLEIVVDDWDEVSSNDFMGRIVIPLDAKHFGAPKRQWYSLQGRRQESSSPPKSSKTTPFGEVELAIHWRYSSDHDYYESVTESDEQLGLPPNELLVAVIRGRDLAAVDRGLFGPATSDPFVKLEIDGEECQTRVKQRTLEPAWHEKFRLPAADAEDACLQITVLDWDVASSADFMGKAQVPLVLLRDRKVRRRWIALEGENGSLGSWGEVEVAMRWIHNSDLGLWDDAVGRDGDGFPGMPPNCLRVSVVRAMDLPPMDFGGTSDPFVRLSVLSDAECDEEDPRRRPGERRPSTGNSRPSTAAVEAVLDESDVHVVSHASSDVKLRTLNPRWYQSFKLQCEAPEDDGNDLAPLCPKLLFEVFDEDEGGPPDFIGHATVELVDHLDRARRRFWLHLQAREGHLLHASARGRLEVVVQWVFDPSFEPDVVVHVARLRVLNVARACGSLSGLFARIAIGGFRAARSSTKAIFKQQRDVSWDDDTDLVLCATRRALGENRVEFELWGTAHGARAKRTLVGRARVRCPRSLLEGNDIGIPITLRAKIDVERSGGISIPPVVEASFSLCPWTPEVAQALRRRKVPELILDVFDDDDAGPGVFLGRAVLRGAQLAAVSTVGRSGGCKSEPRPMNLTLHPRSAQEAKSAKIKVRGTVTVSLHAGRDISFLRTDVRRANARAAATAAAAEIRESAVTIAKESIEAIIDAAWRLMYQGRHLTLHVIGAKALRAPRREKRKAKRDARNALGGLLFSRDGGNDEEVMPNAYFVVLWNGIEVGRSPVCQSARDPSWVVRIALHPFAEAASDNASTSSTSSDNKEALLIIDVYDDEALQGGGGGGGSTRPPKNGVVVEGAFLGRLSLSCLELLQLRRSTAARVWTATATHTRATFDQLLPTACTQFRLCRSRTSGAASDPRQDDDTGERDDDADGSDAPPRVLLYVSNIAVAELPDLRFPVLGGRIHPYVRVKLWNVEARSSTAKGGGTTTTWKRERLSLLVDEGLLSEEPLLVQVWMKRTPPLVDRLLGEARTRLDELVASGGKAVPATLELGRSGHRQQGVVSCSLSYQQADDAKEATDHAGAPEDKTDTAKQVAGALTVGLLVNRDAEAAREVAARARRDNEARRIAALALHEEQKMRAARERLRAEAELALMAAEDFAFTAYYYGEGSGRDDDERALVLLQQGYDDDDADYYATAGAWCGVDDASGLPWRTDEDGYRRFFLGFPRTDGGAR
ncbi:hypothetical protein CTAYLR_007449 [Chrysophaeum taylorii]|uniref:C2 domain-containing protein n=1 Tax=Chrysophaeum taylorii TaxID=2483200 RepID=A0AAD7UCA0_9STRA|nr:hypothetical protein CTAYLR_007449 [Chrysophaeum taylorii]